MKLISEYWNSQMTKSAKVFYTREEEYCVVLKDSLDNEFKESFKNLTLAEYRADDWVSE